VSLELYGADRNNLVLVIAWFCWLSTLSRKFPIRLYLSLATEQVLASCHSRLGSFRRYFDRRSIATIPDCAMEGFRDQERVRGKAIVCLCWEGAC
jgi:hypothetical protein